MYDPEFGSLTYEIADKGKRAHLSIVFRRHGLEERLDYYQDGILERTELSLPDGHFLYEPWMNIGNATMRDSARGGLAPRFDMADALGIEDASIGPEIEIIGTVCESYAFKDGSGLDIERAGHRGFLYRERATRYGEEVSSITLRSADFTTIPPEDLFVIPKGITIVDERSNVK